MSKKIHMFKHVSGNLVIIGNKKKITKQYIKKGEYSADDFDIFELDLKNDSLEIISGVSTFGGSAKYVGPDNFDSLVD